MPIQGWLLSSGMTTKLYCCAQLMWVSIQLISAEDGQRRKKSYVEVDQPNIIKVYNSHVSVGVEVLDMIMYFCISI